MTILCFFASFRIRRDGRPVGHALGEVVPARLLLGAEVGAVEELLQAQDLGLLPGRLGDQLDVLVDHRLLDRGQAGLGAQDVLAPGSVRSGRCGAWALLGATRERDSSKA